jgi:signal transduction histidine kinase
MYQTASGDLSGPDRAYYDHITGTDVYGRLRSMENRLMARGRPGAPIHMTDVQWKVTADSVNTRMRGLELSANARADALSAPVAQGILWRIAGAGVLGLLALVASIWLSVRAATSVVRELRSLRDAALELANERLPSLISRLRRNVDVDAAQEAPPLAFRTQEINAVGDAFNTARRTAIDSAVGEARLRRGISEIFVNLARRSQTLIHRQLSLLDTMENRVTDPEELQDLFRIDHLSTRMRRHAEGLIILSGSAPGRGWRNPVPIVDVVRGAASEVEDYARVKVQAMPPVALSGGAVADVIHLLAELIENATQFSPPHTPVRVVGQVVGNGFVIEVEDRGLSMNGEALKKANEMLAEPPPFDLISSARLGHFVVGRLAGRHDIRVSLRASPYGGTTAIVLLPPSLIAESDDLDPASSGSSGPDTGSFDAELVAVTTGDIRADDARPSFPDVPRPMHAPESRTESVRSEFDDNGYGPPSLADPWSTEPLMPETNGVEHHLPDFGSADGFPSGPMGAFAPPEPPVPPEPPEPAPEPRGKLDDGRPVLPQRVPQTSISPELLDRTDTDDEPPETERSPDEVRSMLSSIQQGWQRGRSEAETHGDAAHPTHEERDR